MSGSARGLEHRPDAWWWNPQAVSLDEALRTVAPGGGEVGVPGGQGVFDALLGRFSAFHLARAHGRFLPGGRGLFAACESGTPAERVLAQGALVPGATCWLDEAAAVSLTVWRRAPENSSEYG
jgi:hypothetical protein